MPSGESEAGQGNGWLCDLGCRNLLFMGRWGVDATWLLVAPGVVLPLVLEGCAAPQPGPVESAAPVATFVVGAEPNRPQAPATAPLETSASCTLHLAAGALNKKPGCVVDEKVTGRSGLLEYPCSGGLAHARFGIVVFLGQVVDGRVDLSLGTEFDFQDGCRWRTEQRIQGALGERLLQYTYREQPVEGEQGCLPSCAASADMSVQ